ncbi:MAG: deoxyribodipyrimidine photo-lyase [Roseibium sp.]|nr:deoxyribodipyrimidine photo-lyase [Roseibium sp.]
MKTIVWFRQDLRIADNPALSAAAERGAVLPVYVLEDGAPLTNSQPLGGAARWWLHHSLAALQRDLGGLIVLKGDPQVLLPELAAKTGATEVMWNRCYDQYAVDRDTAIKAALKSAGLTVESHKAVVLFEPWELQTGAGGPYRVFTPFWKAAKAKGVDQPLPRPASLTVSDCGLSIGVDALGLLPERPNWAKGWLDLWQPGEAGAANRLNGFLDLGLEGYADRRNRPDLPNVSRLSPHLRYGEISPRQIWSAASHAADANPARADDADKFLGEVVWREFAYHLLYHYPNLPTDNWKTAFDAYPWRDSAADLKAWQRGETGYPMVDAGMRELWQTGYMHNRVRMIAASFLIKHLRLHWAHGEAWFRDTLVDADLASNSASWQWVAGSGADAAPYFRIFNPYGQGQKFDPEGDYIRKWVPELAKLETAYLHAPHEAPDTALVKAGIALGTTYPKPMVDHKTARQAALDGYTVVKNSQSA